MLGSKKYLLQVALDGIQVPELNCPIIEHRLGIGVSYTVLFLNLILLLGKGMSERHTLFSSFFYPFLPFFTFARAALYQDCPKLSCNTCTLKSCHTCSVRLLFNQAYPLF